MNKIVILVAVVLIIVGGTMYYTQDRSVEETVVTAEIPDGWVPYENEEFGFSLAYPSDWEVQEALKPRELNALHEIYFHEKEYEMWRAEVTVRIFTNEESLSVGDWWNARLAVEDAKEAECREEYADTAPCLFLRGLVEWQEEGKLSGADSITVGLFRFDHEEECTYTSHGEYILGLCYPGTNPNDSNEDAHKTIYSKMHELFTLVSN